MHTPFLDHVSETWAAQEVPGARSTVKRVPEGGALIIEVEAPRVLATIEAWETQGCVDVTTLDLVTRQGRIHSAGPTKCLEEMEQRFAVLGEFLREYEAPNAV